LINSNFAENIDIPFPMKILDHEQIKIKLKRLAIEILENNLDQHEIIIAGINQNGFRFAELLVHEIKARYDKSLYLVRLKLNPANPLQFPVSLEGDHPPLENKYVIIVDDVASTGRTLFYGFKSIMDTLPAKVEVAVLIDRTHKLFPTKVDYCGLSLATTIQEHINVNLNDKNNFFVEIN
jgi:pyrimidine operon attenuation protein/uracil phosphoribosyltransferase